MSHPSSEKTLEKMSRMQVASVEEDGRVLWFDPQERMQDHVGSRTNPVELTPAQMQQFGLVERARGAINEAVERRGLPDFSPQTPVVDEAGTLQGVQPEKTPDHWNDATRYLRDRHDGMTEAERALAAMDDEPVEGEIDGWRYQRVDDGEQVLWAIDNKPLVERWIATEPRHPDGRLKICPEYQHLVVPDEVLAAICA